MTRKLHKITFIGGTEIFIYIREGEDVMQAAEQFCDLVDMPSDDIVSIEPVSSIERMLEEGREEDE